MVCRCKSAPTEDVRFAAVFLVCDKEAKRSVILSLFRSPEYEHYHSFTEGPCVGTLRQATILKNVTKKE